MVGSHNYWTLNNLGPTKGEDFSRQYQIAKCRLLILFFTHILVLLGQTKGVSVTLLRLIAPFLSCAHCVRGWVEKTPSYSRYGLFKDRVLCRIILVLVRASFYHVGTISC